MLLCVSLYTPLTTTANLGSVDKGAGCAPPPREVLASVWRAAEGVCWGWAVCVQELVQVESLAQVGVQLLLFTLGLEFSLSKLRAVRSVALLGAPSLLLWGRHRCSTLEA